MGRRPIQVPDDRARTTAFENRKLQGAQSLMDDPEALDRECL